MRLIWAALLVVLPARARRLVATRILGWRVDPTAHLGRSIIVADVVVLGPHASIGPFNVIRGLEELRLAAGASIGTRNQIAAHPHSAEVFRHSPRRRAALIMGKEAMITNAHEVDCSDLVELHDHARLAGFGSQILTHSLNLVQDRWVTSPVVLGEHCAVMTSCILQNGTRVPARSVVSAGSVVTTKLTKELTMYRGNPAQEVRALPPTLKYFQRGESGEHA